MKLIKVVLLAAATLGVASLVYAGAPTPLQAPSDYTGPGHVITLTGPYGTTHDTSIGIGSAGANFCPTNGNCTHSGTTNFTGPVQIGGTAQAFPPSGSLLGTSDAQSPINKTIDANANSIQNLATGNFATGVIDSDPTLSANSNARLATQAATKAYTDNAAQGLVYKTPVQLATTANITLSGEQTIDGVLTSNSFVLVNSQADTTQNGIYVSGSGGWTRRSDTNTGALLKNAAVLVTAGSTNINTTWNCPCATITIGTSPVVFVKISGSNVYTPGGGLQLSGNQFSVDSSVNRNNASTITAGVLAAARGGAGAVSGALKADGAGNVSQANCASLSDDGGACTKNVGTTTGTVAAGDDSRIIGAAQLTSANAFTGASTHAALEAFNGGITAQNVIWHRVNPTSLQNPYSAACGDFISSEALTVPLVLILPASPPVSDCSIGLYAQNSLSDILLNPNGGYVKSNDFDRIATTFRLPGSNGHSLFVLRYMPSGIEWQFNDIIGPPTSVYRYNLHHGAVRFDHDPAAARTRLCPHGDGGLIINRKMEYVATPCVGMLDTGVGLANKFDYIYAARADETPVRATDGSGHCPDTNKVCLSFDAGTLTFFESGNPITCVNFGLNATGTPGINVWDDPNTIVANVSGTLYLELTDVTFVAPEASASYSGQTPPECAFTYLKPDSAPILDPLTEVMVNQTRTFETLVGAVFVDANDLVVDAPCERNVASYYNRMPQQMQCVLTTSTATSSSATTYRTPLASFQGQFITFGTPNSGDPVGVPFSAAMRASAVTTGTPTGGLAIVFDGASRGASSACATGATIEPPDNQVLAMAQSVNADFRVSGVTIVPQEARENYMHLCALSSVNAINILGSDSVVIAGAPSPTVMSAMLWQ